MKVLQVYRTYYPDSQGGLEEAIRQIARGTSALGADNRIFSLQRKPGDAVIDYPEATVYRSHRHLSIKSCDIGFKAAPLFKELYRWCDVVHYHFPWPFADLLEAAVGGNKPYIITYHSDIVRQKKLGLIYSPLMNNFLKGAARIIATSDNYCQSSSILANYAKTVAVIPLGIDQASYPDASTSLLETTRQEYGSDFYFFVGVFRYYKGLHILLNAIKDAAYQVVIAGAGHEEEALKEQAKVLGLNNVHFPGFVSDEKKVALLTLSKAVVFPSHLRSEAFGITLLEAAMMGKPMISTEVGTGTSFVNLNETTGLVVAPNNPSLLRRAMDRLYNNPEETKKMGQMARQRYLEKFTGKVVGGSYYQLYQTIINENSHSKPT
ncbi:D-inositol-3-phosphate glycosyltransferase [Sinobacterium norvegicum]|uniref:D-inositol-3-phosphate glycosyltransferase n=1 Tax=Sinobacterium norvegicum TaxID=1641715 RepID=A0ABM9AFM0_9GAMM|nr:glycosyltransferase [Sinobacterium norvegicum]CAH0992005.1 D-inositol-3-phosphate glycosyltransferase [Sinobacterium norvegicum]